MVDAWIHTLYELVQQNDNDAAIDLLFSRIDHHLLRGEFARCGAVLDALDLERLNVELIVGVLSITFAAADQLPGRVSFVERARARLLVLAPDRTDALLSGLVLAPG